MGRQLLEHHRPDRGREADEAGNPPLRPQPLAARWPRTTPSGSRVYFTDADNHVHELAWTGSGWNTTDLTAVATWPGGQPAAVPRRAGSALASHDSGGSRVYFTDADNHVHELAWTGSGWNTTDLTIQLQPSYWMKGVDGSFYLSQLSIPGTHDTLSFNATLVAQDQDIGIAAQLNAGIRWFDLRLAEDDPNGDGTDPILVGSHGGTLLGPFIIANTEFWAYVLTPTIQFLQANPSECVVYSAVNCGYTANCTVKDPAWPYLLFDYITKYGPGDGSWGGFYVTDQVPKLDDVRGKIVLGTGDADYLAYVHSAMDFSNPTLNQITTYQNTLQLPTDSERVTFYVQGIYDDSNTNTTMAVETAAIQKNITDAAANTDPHNWYMTSTARAGGEPTSKYFATGWKAGEVPLPYPSTWEGYNTVAQDQINQVPLIGGSDQQTVGTVTSDFPNDTPGYIQAIYNRNPRGLGRTQGSGKAVHAV